jgi:DNA-nicking Smr family endonuclease
MVRRLAPEEKALWGKVMATVKPLHHVIAMPPTVAKPVRVERSRDTVKSSKAERPLDFARGEREVKLPQVQNTLDSTWDRRIHKVGVIPDISVDLHETNLSGAYARLDSTLEQAIHQKLRVVLLVTGKPREHDRASGPSGQGGRGAIAAVVRDWLASSRHAGSISAVRNAHPRHGGAGALYIVLKR